MVIKLFSFLWLLRYFHRAVSNYLEKTHNYPGGASFQVFRFDLLFFVLVVRLTLSELYASLVSCVHATIQPALSVGRSVGHTLPFFMILFL